MDYIPVSVDVSEKLLKELMWSIRELLPKIAPDGFAHSELLKVYHPTPEQQYKEYRFAKLRFIQIQRSMNKTVDTEPTKSYNEFLNEAEDTSIEEQYEITSIFGKCIWDIFSNNHTVFNERNESYNLGSWRGSGEFIADVINELLLVPNSTFDYMDFYMGHFVGKNRADMTNVYRFIFQKLKERNLDWEYSFQRMGIVSFGDNDAKTDDPANYDPGRAMITELEKMERKKKLNDLQEMFDHIYREGYEKARYEKPEQEVMAYFKVYNQWPIGHPFSENK